jgi:hypothetical protein
MNILLSDNFSHTINYFSLLAVRFFRRFCLVNLVAACRRGHILVNLVAVGRQEIHCEGEAGPHHVFVWRNISNEGDLQIGQVLSPKFAFAILKRKGAGNQPIFRVNFNQVFHTNLLIKFDRKGQVI